MVLKDWVLIFPRICLKAHTAFHLKAINSSLQINPMRCFVRHLEIIGGSPPEEERVCKHNPEVISFGDEGHLHNLQNITAVHKDVTERLEKLNKALFDEVRAVLDINKAERHVRGGEATKQKYIRNSAITSK